MSFSDILQAKIEARRMNGSSIAATVKALQQRALDRLRPVHDGFADMLMRIAQDPMFAVAFGTRPEIKLKWSATIPEISDFTGSGPAGELILRVREMRRLQVKGQVDRPPVMQLSLHIVPDIVLEQALGCGLTYAEATPVEGDATDIAGFLVAAEDRSPSSLPTWRQLPGPNGSCPVPAKGCGRQRAAAGSPGRCGAATPTPCS